jgi:hypothetical protein
MTRSIVSSKAFQGDEHLKKIDARPKRKVNISNSENGWDKEPDVHNLILTGKYSG